MKYCIFPRDKTYTRECLLQSNDLFDLVWIDDLAMIPSRQEMFAESVRLCVISDVLEHSEYPDLQNDKNDFKQVQFHNEHK